MMYGPVLAFAVWLSLGSLGMGAIACAGESADRPIMQQDLANPLIGSRSDDESTRMPRHRAANPSKDQRPEQSAQVMLGGAKSPVVGWILRIEDGYYFVKDEESGGEVRLVVNKDTNMDCGAAKSPPSAQSGRVTSERQSEPAPGATKKQQAQGQRKDETAIGSGFRTDGCSFQEGDRIKAEVSDIGTVTTLKWIADEKGTPSATARAVGEGALTGELAIPSNGVGMPKQDKPGQLNMVGPHGGYVVPPVPQGTLQEQKGRFSNARILSADGKILATLTSLIADVTTGEIEYAVIRLADTGMLVPVHWADLQITKDRGSLVLHARQYQLKPDLTAKDVQNRAPAINEKDIQAALAPPDLRDGPGEMVVLTPILPMPADKSCPTCSVVRGQVQDVEGEFLILKDGMSKQEVRLHVDQETQPGQVPVRKGGEFRPGDSVEAYVTPEGHALTLSMIRAAEHMELPDN